MERNNRSNFKSNFGHFTTSVYVVFVAGDCRHGKSLVVWAIVEQILETTMINKFVIKEDHLITTFEDTLDDKNKRPMFTFKHNWPRGRFVESHNPKKNGNNIPNRPFTYLVIEVVKGIKVRMLFFKCLTLIFNNSNKEGLLEASTTYSKAFVMEKWSIRYILVPLDVHPLHLYPIFFLCIVVTALL